MHPASSLSQRPSPHRVLLLYHKPLRASTFFFALVLAVFHCPIVTMQIIVASNASMLVLHVVNVILARAGLAVCHTLGVNVNPLAIRISHHRIALHRASRVSVNHVEQYTGNPTYPQQKRNQLDRVRNPLTLLAKARNTTPPLFLLTGVPRHAIMPAAALQRGLGKAL